MVNEDGYEKEGTLTVDLETSLNLLHPSLVRERSHPLVRPAPPSFYPPEWIVRKAAIPKLTWASQRSVSTLPHLPNNTQPFQYLSHHVNEAQSNSIAHYVSRLSPFSAPSVPQPVVETFELTSVLRKRRLKMNKHKHKKLRKRTRALRKRLGK
ncbi:hypothetical protein BY458DRAFT_586223 [Sporodiniella umbellata]|nr:hypothetical protein BY458DRAFT_586223 [Sporodiniella umbellata]